MRYFIPDWDDRVDPEYDFITDTHSKLHREDPNNDAYMWDLLGVDKVPFDGVLVSVATTQKNKRKYAAIKEKGIHQFFRLPDDFPIMADCGAFSYINEDVPPYKTSDILEIYSELGFNYGVSIDHLVVEAFKDKKDERMEITLQNGLDAFEQWKKKYRDDFQLIVSVQGYETDDYLRMYHTFLEHGVTHMAMGGLVRSPTPEIVTLIDHIIADIKDTKKMPEYLHFFGLARPNLFFRLKELEDLGVEVAFDSASYLRRAWLGSVSSQNNYITQDQKGYTAIRIPQEKTSKKQQSEGGKKTPALEQACLHALRAYDAGEMALEDVMNILETFTRVNDDKPELLNYYRRTLQDQPWKSCPCPICQKNGVEIIIFRGNNRNRRRGFHNTISFHSLLNNKSQWDRTYLGKDIETLEGFSKKQSVLVITGCTKNKCEIEENRKIAAKDLYTGTLFTKVQDYCEKMEYDYRIISAKYGLLSPEDKISTYEKVLRTRVDVDAIRPSVEESLKPLLKDYNTILVIAGSQYRDVLSRIIDDKFVFLKADGIGDMIHKVSIAIPNENRTIDEFAPNQQRK